MNGWIGVDLDGTLAKYDGWKGIEHIGEPVPLMVKRVKNWLKEGKNVKIFTARICDGKLETRDVITKWCKEHLGEVLEITNVKDYGMIELWDDRCIQVEANTGYAKQEISNMILHSTNYPEDVICPCCYGEGCWMCDEE